MTKKKNFQGNRAKKRKLHPKKKPQNQNKKANPNIDVQLHQIKFYINELAKRVQGIGFGFDSYIKMKGEDESLNSYIKDIINEKKNTIGQEKKQNESSGSDSTGSSEKPVGTVS